MNTKTLHTIQKLAKVGRILSKIIAICCIVGAVGCLVGVIALLLGDFEAVNLGGITIHGIIEKSAEVSIGTMYASMTVVLILCTAEAVMAKLAQRYFQNEIAAGTPFTFDGAKEMQQMKYKEQGTIWQKKTLDYIGRFKYGKRQYKGADFECLFGFILNKGL